MPTRLPLPSSVVDHVVRATTREVRLGEDPACDVRCATCSTQVDRLWCLAVSLGGRRCEVRTGRRGGARLEWAILLEPAASGRDAGGR